MSGQIVLLIVLKFAALQAFCKLNFSELMDEKAFSFQNVVTPNNVWLKHGVAKKGGGKNVLVLVKNLL